SARAMRASARAISVPCSSRSRKTRSAAASSSRHKRPNRTFADSQGTDRLSALPCVQCAILRFRFWLSCAKSENRGSRMYLPPRHAEIIRLAKDNGRVLVEELSAHFGVTPQTIRKDLNELCDRRLLSRIHGGALFPSGIENVQYEARRKIAADEKDAIGRAAAKIIPDNASLFVNIGTTTEAVSNALLDHKGLMVITNNINVANRMRVYPSIEVVIAGGVVRGSDGGIVGEAAVDFIRQFKVDYAVIGTS